MDVAPIIARLIDQVDELFGRVEGALELAELLRQNALPHSTPCAYVLPLGLRGRQADAAAGLFRQNYDQVVGVLLFVTSAGDVTGAGALPDLDVVSRKVIETIAGWAPDEAIGVYVLSRADLVSLKEGMAIYQIDFSLESQLRLTPQP